MFIEASAYQRAQPGRDIVTAEDTCGDSKSEVFPFVSVEGLVFQQPVLTEKHKARRECDTFVAIDKGMIAAQAHDHLTL